MKKKLQLTESQLIEFIENTVKKIKKEKQPKTIKLNESDLYKIVGIEKDSLKLIHCT